MNTLDEILKQVYKPAYEYHFRFHPRKEVILKAIEEDQLTFREIDLVFAEAEYYAWKQLLEREKRIKDGTVTYEMRETKNE